MKLTKVLRAGGGGGVPQWGYKFKPGGEFGQLDDRVRGSVMYRISPYEQRAFAGVIDNIKNTIGRLANFVITVCPFFVVGKAVHDGVTYAYHQGCRKNPDDYKEYYEATDEVAYKKKKIKRKWPKQN